MSDSVINNNTCDGCGPETEDEEYSYDILEDDTLIIWGFNKGKLYDIVDGNGNVIVKEGCVFVPQKIGGHIVSEIDEFSFSPCDENCDLRAVCIRSNIQRVYLPDTIRAIGADAFNGCEALREIYIPGNNLVKIGSSDFSGIDSTRIDAYDHPFVGCDGLTIYCNKFCSKTWHSLFSVFNAFPYYQIPIREVNVASKKVEFTSYKDKCKQMFLGHAFKGNIAYLGIDGERAAIDIPLAKRAFKVFDENLNKDKSIRIRVWAFTHFLLISLKTGEFNEIYLPYSPYVNDCPTYLVDISDSLKKINVTAFQKNTSRTMAEWLLGTNSSIGDVADLLIEHSNRILSCPFIGIEQYLCEIERYLTNPLNWTSLSPDAKTVLKVSG